MKTLIDLDDWQRRIHALATEKGWWDGVPRDEAGRVQMTPDQILAKLALIHSEVSEALEAVRIGEMEVRFREDGKPDGFPIELADVVIRCLDLAGAMGISLETAIIRKHAFNATRPRRHGGKAA